MIIWQLDSNTHSAAGTWCIKKHHKPERSIARRCRHYRYHPGKVKNKRNKSGQKTPDTSAN